MSAQPKSEFMASEDWLPSFETFERACASLSEELDRLLAAARSEHQVIEEASAGERQGSPFSLTSGGAHRLRRVRRSLARAHALLIEPSDERYGAAQRVLEWLEHADRADAPWRSAA